MNLENSDLCLEMEEWCINNLVQYMKRPVVSTRNEGHTPASFCKKTDELWNDVIEQLGRELRGLNAEDLKKLYTHISKNLEERNGYVADFNVLLASLMGCNSNSLFLGSREQSKGALFYIGPYICKNLVPIIDSFALLLEAQDHAQTYPSRADDASTDKRFVQYVLTRVLNKMNSLMEISDTQAAVGLLGMNAGICSEIFTAYDASSYINYVLRELKERSGISNNGNNCIEHSDSDNNDEGSMASFIEYDSDSSQETCKGDVFSTGDDDPDTENNSNHTSELHNFEPIQEDMHDIPTSNCPFESSYEPSSSYASCPVYTIDDGERLVAVPYPEFYRCRGSA